MSKRIKRRCAACGEKVTKTNIHMMTLQTIQDDDSVESQNFTFCSFQCMAWAFLSLCFEVHKNDKEEFVDKVSDAFHVDWTQAALLYEDLKRGILPL